MVEIEQAHRFGLKVGVAGENPAAMLPRSDRIKYFQEFCNPRLSREDLIEILMTKEGYAESGSTTRVTQSRRIISAGRADDALKIIAESYGVDYQSRKRAEVLRGGNQKRRLKQS
jgi:hypothetical protein